MDDRSLFGRLRWIDASLRLFQNIRKDWLLILRDHILVFLNVKDVVLHVLCGHTNDSIDVSAFLGLLDMSGLLHLHLSSCCVSLTLLKLLVNLFLYGSLLSSPLFFLLLLFFDLLSLNFIFSQSCNLILPLGMSLLDFTSLFLHQALSLPLLIFLGFQFISSGYLISLFLLSILAGLSVSLGLIKFLELSLPLSEFLFDSTHLIFMQPLFLLSLLMSADIGLLELYCFSLGSHLLLLYSLGLGFSLKLLLLNGSRLLFLLSSSLSFSLCSLLLGLSCLSFSLEFGFSGKTSFFSCFPWVGLGEC